MNEENKLFPYLNTFPEISEKVFLAPGVKIVGKVEISEKSSVWYNTVIRGDVHYVKIGKNTNIQDMSMLHVTNDMYPLNIGDNVTIGHSVTLHGCTLEDNTFIGMGAVVLDGAKIEKNSMVGAGAVVKQGFIVPSGKLVAGVPAKVVRNLSSEEISAIQESADRYYKYSEITKSSFENNVTKTG